MLIKIFQVYLEIYSNYSEARPNVFLQVRINSLANKSRIRDLIPSDIDKLISIRINQCITCKTKIPAFK